jgi:hypothetical protein
MFRHKLENKKRTMNKSIKCVPARDQGLLAVREELAVQPVVDERTPGRVAALLLLESFRRLLERKLVTCACSVSPCVRWCDVCGACGAYW